MKITKFVHSCLLVEMPAPVNRTVLFDPGVMSQEALGNHRLEYLDDIVITHEHIDHFYVPLIKKLVDQFPRVSILAPADVVSQLQAEGFAASDQPSDGLVLFDAPHEVIEPLFDGAPPVQRGIHYLDTLTDPGDSHSFNESKQILALPVQAPWGSARRAVELALQLRPEHILPIHDWHWSEEARHGVYEQMETVFAAHNIKFHKLETGVPIVVET